MAEDMTPATSRVKSRVTPDKATDRVRARVKGREELDKLPPLVSDDLERLDGEGPAPVAALDLEELDDHGCRGCGQPPSPQTAAGNPEALAAYWEDRMSCEPGDFDECVAGVSQYVDNPEGYCQERHIAACGEPAGKGAHGGSAEAHVAYAPDQEREDDGKFADGGGSSSSKSEKSKDEKPEKKGLFGRIKDKAKDLAAKSEGVAQRADQARAEAGKGTGAQPVGTGGGVSRLVNEEVRRRTAASLTPRDEYGFPIPPGTVAAPPPPKARPENPPSSSPPPDADKPDHPCHDANSDGMCDECGKPCADHPTDESMAGPPAS